MLGMAGPASHMHGTSSVGKTLAVTISRPGTVFDQENLCLFYDINMEEIRLFQVDANRSRLRGLLC